MSSARLARFVWPGMVLAGLALAAATWAAWPEPTVRIVRLPYGEAGPKTPLVREPAVREVAKAPAPAATTVAAPPAVEQEPAPAAVEEPEAEEETGRVLAAVEPSPATAPATAAPTTEQVEEAWGPDPVPSVLDGMAGYEPKSPEELGASPLPGFDVTPQAPPVAG